MVYSLSRAADESKVEAGDPSKVLESGEVTSAPHSGNLPAPQIADGLSFDGLVWRQHKAGCFVQGSLQQWAGTRTEFGSSHRHIEIEVSDTSLGEPRQIVFYPLGR